MRPSLNIDFVDFWTGFLKTDNLLFNVLSVKYNVIISDKPEIIFYSVYGSEYLKYDCLRIFYSAENVRPDFTACDFAITFDYNNRTNHYRLPLYKWYLGSRTKPLAEFLVTPSLDEIKESWFSKKKFCCMVVSNPHSRERNKFFKKLSSVTSVDSGGRYLNNIGGAVADKMKFIRDYKFVIAYENSSYPGYVTEKLLEPLACGSIPIYWGDPQVGSDFNKKRFLDRRDFSSDEALIEKILELDRNDQKAIDLLAQPVFNENKVPECIKDENLLNFLAAIIDKRSDWKPVAGKHSFRIRHNIKRKVALIRYIIHSKLGLNFR